MNNYKNIRLIYKSINRISIISFSYFLVIILFLNGCTLSHLASCGLKMQAGEYEKAIPACEAALKANKEGKPLMIKPYGENVNADYLSTFCLGISYMMLEEYDKSEKNFFENIALYPNAAYMSYMAIAQMMYKQGKLKEAYQYSIEASKTVGTSNYYKMQQYLKAPPDLYKNIIEAARDFYKMRLLFQNLNYEMGLHNYQNALKISDQIINKKYKVHFGADTGSTKIEFISEGGIADLNGLIQGDKILEINNTKIESPNDLWREGDKLLTMYGKTVKYKIERNGRIIDIEAKMEYPEIEQTKLILQQAKLNLASKFNKKSKQESGPWLKILEPKAARGIKIISNQIVSFVILASGKNAIRKVTVNDINCSVSDNISLLEKSILPGNAKKYIVNLPLTQGNNQFIVKVFDTAGKIAMKQIEIQGNQTLSRKLDRVYDHKVAIIIGINKYLSSDYSPLDFAIRDAQAIKEQVIKMGFDKVIEISESKATRSGILRVLADELPYTLGQNDALFIYFAGHGATEELKSGDMEGYILPNDANKSNYRGTAISMEKIRDVIKRYKAKHILLVFDSCYSGYGAIPRTLDKSAHRHDAVQIITAGGRNETAGEDLRIGHGIFTKTFLDTFDNKSLYSDEGFITASDIGHFVKKEVSKLTRGKQNPQSRYIEGEGDFKFKNFE